MNIPEDLIHGLPLISTVPRCSGTSERTETHRNPCRYRSADRRMGRPRDEISGWRKSAVVRATDREWKTVRISDGYQRHGIAPPHGHGFTGFRYSRRSARNSAYPEGKT